MEQALRRRAATTIDERTPAIHEVADDDLGFASGLVIAIPVGLAIWALAIWTVYRVIA